MIKSATPLVMRNLVTISKNENVKYNAVNFWVFLSFPYSCGQLQKKTTSFNAQRLMPESALQLFSRSRWRLV